MMFLKGLSDRVCESDALVSASRTLMLSGRFLTSTAWGQVLAGFGLLSLTSQISIPIQPVPVTLQSLAALFLGFVLSPQRVLQAYGVWVLAGACGLPVFQDFSFGLAKLGGPTGGYFLGMGLAALFLAGLRTRPRFSGALSFGTLLATSFGASGIIYFFGLLWLSCFVGWNQAVTVGLLPFLLPGILKAIALSILLRGLGILRQPRQQV